MKPEALSAMVGPSMRPSPLEATTSQSHEDGPAQGRATPSNEEHSRDAEKVSTTSEQASTPFGQHTDGTQSAAKVVEEVVHGVKAVVGGVIAWAEKKVEDLSSEADSTGPYTSQATCVPSDLDPIASGVLATMPMQRMDGTDESVQAQNDGDEKEKKHATDENADGEGKNR